MKASGILFLLFLFLVTLMAVQISNVSASAIGRTYTAMGGDITCDTVSEASIKSEVVAGNPIFVVYKGEKIRFRSSAGEMRGIRIDGKFTATGSPSSSNFKTYFISEEWDTEGKYEGYYRFSDDADANGSYLDEGTDNQGWLSLDTHTFRLDLYPTEKTYADGSLNLNIESSNKEAGFMKFSVESGGHSIRDIYGNDIYEVQIEYKEETIFCNISRDISGVDIRDGKIMLNMSDLDVEEGRYTIVLEDSATGVDKKLNFEVEPREIEIDVDDEIVKGETVEIIVKSAFSNKKARLLIDDGDVFNQSVILNEEGEKMLRWNTRNATLGKHEIRIKVDVDGDDEFGGYEDEEASCYIEIIEGGVTVEAPDEVILGNPVLIEGTSTYGDYAVILIDGIYVDKAKIYRNKFEYEYKTVGALEGPKKVEVFIDAPIEFGIGEEVSEEWTRENNIDADTEFTVIESHELTLDIPQITAEGDAVLINGTAAGVDNVYLLVLNRKGEVIFPYAAKATATPVDGDGKWDEKLIEPDIGTYTAIVLLKGMDGVTEAIYDGKWMIGDESKTLDQRIAIVEDKIKGAGSDDIFVKKGFKVVNSELKLELEDIALGDNLTIVARTNVKDGVIAWIRVLKEGSKERETKTVKVENGTIIAGFDTNKFSNGRWEVSVNIPDRCSDRGIVNITAETSTPASGATPNATVTSSVTPTPSAISVPEEKGEAPIPGFELVFSLVLLITVAYLIRAKARKSS
jgi:hypothetical protein